jgi:hypothetical protein
MQEEDLGGGLEIYLESFPESTRNLSKVKAVESENSTSVSYSR